MSLYAVDDLDDALAVTRRFLLPFELRKWAKLALVAFFVGIPAGNVVRMNTPVNDVPRFRDAMPSRFYGEVLDDPWLVALGVATIVAAIVVTLLFFLVASIMEFVLVESLRAEKVTIRRYWLRRWRQGLRLFAFRVALGLLVLGPVVVVVAVAVLPFVLTGSPGVSVFALLFLVPIIFLLALFVGLINAFTTAFVVPIMVLEDCGVLAGWRRLWPTVRSQLMQYGAYAVAAFVLSIAAGILVGIATAILAVALLIPFGILGALGWLLLSATSPIGIAVLGVAAAAFAISALVAFAFVGVPVVTYLRYYALLVLGDTNETFDLVSDQRAAVREDESGSPDRTR